jgi:hypothetical protein
LFNPVRRLTAASLLTIFMPVSCWLVVAWLDRLPLWIPYISDLALIEPATRMFQIGMVVIALLYLSLLPHVHNLVPYRAATGLYIASAIGMIVVGSYDWISYPWVHYIAAIFAFGGFSAWTAIATFRVRPSGWRIGLIIVTGGLCIALVTLSVSYAAMPVSADAMAWTERPWSMTIAASIEWLLLLSLALVGLSFRKDLSEIQASIIE